MACPVLPKPPRLVVVVVCEALGTDERPVSGTEVEDVTEVDWREKIGRDQWLVLLLVVLDHER